MDNSSRSGRGQAGGRSSKLFNSSLSLTRNIYKDFSSGKGGGIMQFCRDMLGARGREMTIRPTEITKHILQRYQRTLFRYRKKNGRPLSFSSLHVHILALKGFFKWLSKSKSNFILYNPAADLEYPKIYKRLPRHILTIEEVESILNQPDLTTGWFLSEREP